MKKQIIIDNIATTYYITDDGKLYNEKTGRWYEGRVSASGYLDYILRIDGKQKSFRAHRLVAEYFIPNPNNFPVVNHKDGNKLNNTVDNLEWVSQQENVLHAYRNNLIKKTCFYNKQEDIEDEVWKEIEDSHYLVSNYGRVKNIVKNNILAGKRDTGYVRYEITKNDGSRKTYLAHRLVMCAFKQIDLEDKSGVVNHINGDKMDNRLENLEWVTKSDNMLKAYYETKTNSKTRPIIQYDLNMNFIKEWNGANEAARNLGLRQSGITAACQRKGSSAGFQWRYKNEISE